MTSRRRRANSSIYQLKITLKDIRPPIWRRLQLVGSATLYELHLIILSTMGWDGGHLFEFTVGETTYSDTDIPWDVPVRDAGEVELARIAPKEKSKFSYVYDFGDHWEMIILVEQILEPDPARSYPRCTAGKRAGPPEDCGGPWGYQDLLEILRDPNHEEYEDRTEWLGGPFDPEAFNLKEIDEAVRSRFTI
jgi:hypothetical protein